MLSSDFQWLNREGDVLQKAFHPDLGEFLTLTEVQLRPDPRIPKRVRAYTALAEERYNLPVYPVVVNILPPSRKVDPSINSYSYEILGLQIRQDYRVINLWEIDAEIVLQQPLITLLPFVPILRGGGQESMLQRAVILLREQEPLRELEPLLAFFAGFVLETQVVQQIMRWDMTVLRESPWYNQFLEEGLQQGLQQGQLELVNRLLNKRLGAISWTLQAKVTDLPLEKLQNLGEALLDMQSMTDLESWLDNSGS